MNFCEVLSITETAVRGILQTRGRGILEILTSLLFRSKHFGFFEIKGVSARTRRVDSVRMDGGGEIFRDFVRTFFMDGLLIDI